MEENKDVLCGRCKSYKYPNQFFKNGKRLKACSDCRMREAEQRERNKCEHGRRKDQCKECGGTQICEHGRQKDRCKECGGASFCEHGRIKNQCKECGGALFCEHGRRKDRCKECGGSSICEHGRRKDICKECGGSRICPHGREKNLCKECDPLGHLTNIVRSRVYDALKNDKELASSEYLGCDIGTFKKHIEGQFTKGMSWDNHGEWHIDHIVPLKYDNPTLEETCERLHYTNTQPLWATENMAKGNRFIG